MYNKFAKILMVLLSLIACVSLLIVPSYAALSDLAATDNSVSLDGTSDATVTVGITTPVAIDIYGIEGFWSVSEEEGGSYFTLSEITSDKFVFVNSNVNVADTSDGYVYCADDSFNVGNFTAHSNILAATYTVSANTPAGVYTVKFTPDMIVDYDINFISDVFTFTITVTTASTEPACDHVGKTYTYESINGNTHKVTCECGEVVAAAENHDYTNGACSKCSRQCSHDNDVVDSTYLGKWSNDDGNTHSEWALCDCGTQFRVGSTIECTVNNADGDCTTAENCECGREMTPASAGHVEEADDGDCTTAVKCKNCDQIVTPASAGHVAGADDGDCTTAVKCANCEQIVIEAKAAHADAENDGNHKCDICDTDNISEHTGGTATCMAQKVCTECGAGYGDLDPTKHAGTDVTYTNNGDTHSATYDCCGAPAVTEKPHSYNLENNNYECVCGAKFTGWDGDCYIKEAEVQKTGWTAINGAWYYLDTVTGIRAKGMTRVPYPTEPIEGVTYVPNADDVAYAESKDKTFIDKDEAWFFFGLVSGEFQNATTVFIDNNNTEVLRYAVKGMIVWHPGFVTVENELYYFVGDAENGGNKLANGEIYVTRNCKVAGYTKGDKLTFVDGKVKTDLDGIVNGYYYENGKLMAGAGLVKWNGDIYYVRSNGEVATGKYYINVNKTNGIDLGTNKLFFDEDGKLLDVKNGIYEEDGKRYYYVGNRKACGAGLVEIDGDYYYVRSTGEVQTGYFFITKTNATDGFTSGDKCLFGEDGKLVKNFGSEQK